MYRVGRRTYSEDKYNTKALQGGMGSLLLFLCCFALFDFFLVADAGGCSGNLTSNRPACSQICTTRTDGHLCSCREGYTLNNKDNTTCIIQGDAPVLFYQTGTTLKVLYTDTQSHFDVKEHVEPIHKMAFGPNSTLYWIDVTTGTVYSMYFDWEHQGSDVNVVIDSGTVFPNGLVVDSLTSVLYVVDTSLGHIVACTTKGDNCSVIVSNLDRPLDVNIHQRNRKLIWINKGRGRNSGTINMAELDGKGHMILVAGLRSPYSFVVDETIDALFWISSQRNNDEVIQMMYMSKRDIISVQHIPKSKAVGMSILGDFIYLWIQTEGQDEVQKLDKFTGQTMKAFTLDDLVTAKIYHPVLHSAKREDNPCEHSACSHLCLPRDRHSNRVSCHCPVYMNLVSETMCVVEPEMPKVIVSGMAGIFELPAHFIGRSESEVRQLTNRSADILVYDSLSQHLIFYDSQQRSIMTAEISDIRSTIKELYAHILYVEALAFNEMDNVLYWTTLQGKVFAAPVKENSNPRLLYDSFNNPRGMAIDGRNGHMYLCDWGKEAQIVRCQLDGSQCLTILGVPDGHPNMITLEDGNRLYWTDSKADTIGSLDLNTNKSTEVTLTGHRNPHPFCIETSRDRVYYTDLNTGQLHYIDKSNPALLHTLHLNVGTLYGMALIFPVTASKPKGGPVFNYGQTDKPRPTYPDDGGIIKMFTHPPTSPPPIIRLLDVLSSNALPTRTSSRGVDDGAGVTEATMTTSRGVDDTVGGTVSPITTPPGVRMNHEEIDVGLVILAISLVLGLILLIAVSTWVCYCRRKKPHEGWMVKLVKFVKSNPDDDDDGEQLLSSAHFSSDPSFKHFDDVDYPDPSKDRQSYDINSNRRDVSRFSTDSAFTEMHDGASTLYLTDE